MRILADENFHNDILRGLLQVNPELDIVRVQDTEVYQADDPTVLEWAAKTNSILLTHDVQTVTKFAYERVKQGLPMPGVIEVSNHISIGQAVEEILIVLEASDPSELENRVIFIPL
jgi:predicted nuclease of predicted toxin-antitoxin system